MKKTKKITLLASAVLTAMLTSGIMAGCGNSSNSVSNNDVKNEAKSEFKPITLTTFEHKVTYDKVPKRAVSLNQHTTEMMLALGLQDKMVGTAFLDDEILPEYKNAYDKIPVLAKQYPSKEKVLEVEPDIVIGRSSAFNEKKVATIEGLEDMGIKSYVSKSSYTTGATMDDVYEDINNLGKIFKVENKAKNVMDTMKKEIKNVQDKIKDKNKVKVFIYDSGKDKPYTAANGLVSNIVKLAGGENIFSDIPKTWAEVSWEEVVKRDPEYIIIMDYDGETVEQKKENLLKNPALADVKAVKNKSIVVLPLSDVFAGVRNATAVRNIAKGLYGDVIK